MSIVHEGDDLFVTADWSALAEAGSPEAAFQLVCAGGTVPRRYEDLYRELLGIEQPEEAEPDPSRTVTFGKPRGGITPKPDDIDPEFNSGGVVDSGEAVVVGEDVPEIVAKPKTPRNKKP